MLISAGRSIFSKKLKQYKRCGHTAEADKNDTEKEGGDTDVEQARIMDIKRFAVHDGDGIRTTVFFKGCPLRCLWCHNPEGLSFAPEVAFYEEKCIGCGECVRVCPQGVHRMEEPCETGTGYWVPEVSSGAGKPVKQGPIHFMDRRRCIGCGACENVCIGKALKVYGKLMTVDELMPLLLEDRIFYENSGGGVTLSGGECLAQAGFCGELLKALKKEHIHTAVDTCGYVKEDFLNLVIPYTDIFLYDMKAMEEEVHLACTGKSNRIILENLKYLDDCGKETEIRIPYVPGCNSDQIEQMAEFLSGMKHLKKVRVLPYHNYAASKYKALGIRENLPKVLPDEQEIADAAAVFVRRGIVAE